MNTEKKEVTVLDLLLKIENIIPRFIQSWDKFNKQFEAGTILHLPVGCSIGRGRELYLSYYESSFMLSYHRYGEVDPLIEFNSTYRSLENTIDVHSNAFCLSKKDQTIGVRFDKDDSLLHGAFDFDDDICYLNGNEYFGIEEALFQLSLVHDMREPHELINEGKTAMKVLQQLPENWCMTCDDSRIIADLSVLDDIQDLLF